MSVRIQNTHMVIGQPRGVGFGRGCSCAARQCARSAVVLTRATMPQHGGCVAYFFEERTTKQILLRRKTTKQNLLRRKATKQIILRRKAREHILRKSHIILFSLGCCKGTSWQYYLFSSNLILIFNFLFNIINILTLF